MIAHVDFDTGLVRQWMSYDAYGVMKVLRPGDFNGDGLSLYLYARGNPFGLVAPMGLGADEPGYFQNM